MSRNDEVLALKKDARWDAWRYGPEKFLEIAERIQFHPGVPEGVVGRFNMIKKLILHSYYEYEFLDIAFARALTTFEMALRLRYRDLMSKESKSMTLERLINLGSERGLFDKGEQFIQPLRHLRNYSAHPTHHSFVGHLVIEPILMIVEVINHIFIKEQSSRLSREGRGPADDVEGECREAEC